MDLLQNLFDTNEAENEIGVARRLDIAEVEAATEVLSFAAQHAQPNVGCVVERVPQTSDQICVQSIRSLGSVESELEYVVSMFDAERVGISWSSSHEVPDGAAVDCSSNSEAIISLMARSSDDAGPKDPDVLDLHLDAVAGGHVHRRIHPRADARWCAGREDVARP